MSKDEVIEEEIASSQSKETKEEIETIEPKVEKENITKMEDIIEEELKTDDDIIFKSDNIHTNDDEISNLNKIVIIVGYICALIVPLIGFIYGIILICIKKPPAYRSHGTYILIVSILMWIIYFIIGLT